MKNSAGYSSPIYANMSYEAGDDDFFTSPSPPSTYSADGGSGFSALNGEGFDGGFDESNGPILPPPGEMESDEGFALREWRRLNAIQLAEKEKKEKEMLIQIIEEADEFKAEFYRKRKITFENNKTTNREKEKLFMADKEKFHAEAEKNYWKAIAELIPKEVPPSIERRGKKDKEKKTSIAVIQGPKPGKPTDLSRMRQILVKLKYNTPPHMKPKPPAPAPLPAASEPVKDAKTGAPAAAAATTTAPVKAAAMPVTPQA